uniref:LamG domain-containing protein n=1 Tax=Neptunomonas sp. TaxID=1971898 RepID=UPI003562EA24
MLIRLFLIIFIYLGLITSVQAAECRATFADGLTNSSNAGKIKFEDSAQLLNNPDAILVTTDIDNRGDVSSCGGVNCSASGAIVPQLNSSYIEYSSSNNLVVDGTIQTISANDYKDVTVKSGGSLSMTATFSSYHFKKLKVEDSSVIYLTAGDYFVEEIEIKDSSQLIVQGSGTARIYIEKKAKFKESSVINGGESGDPSRLVLYSFDDVTVESAASLAGYIYSEKKVEIKDNSKVVGAISSEGELKLKDNASVSYDDSIDDTDFGSMCDSSPLATPVVNYRFDSCNWADAQDVVDSGPNRLDAYAVNGVLSTVGGQVCGLAQFDSADDYVRLPDTNEVDLPDTLTAMAWVYLNSTPSGLKTILSKDTNYEFHVNTNREIFWWWNDANGITRSFTSGVQIGLGQWHHVAITYQSGLQIIYIDGQEAARRTFTGQLITNSNDLQIGQDQGIGSRFFDGDIDEVKIFDVDLSAVDIADIFINEEAGRNYDGALRSCNCTEPVAVNHYAISHDMSMVSCLAEDITFTAHDNADLAVDAKDALLQISTSTMKGEWLSVVTGSGVLTNSGGGQATYRFPDNGESSVTLRLSYPDLASDPELVNFNVTDGVSTDKRNSSHREDSNLSVSDSGLVFSIPDTQSCQASLAVSIRAVKKSDNSLSCSGAVAGNRTVNFYSQYLAPSTGTKNLILTSDGVAYPLSSSAPGTPVAVRFDSQGEGSISI